MKTIGSLLSMLGKLLKFGSGVIGLLFMIRSDMSLLPGISMLIVVSLVVCGIGFLIESLGVAMFASNDN